MLSLCNYAINVFSICFVCYSNVIYSIQFKKRDKFIYKPFLTAILLFDKKKLKKFIGCIFVQCNINKIVYI